MTELSLGSGAQLAQTAVGLGNATALYESARADFAAADVAGLNDGWMQIENNPVVARYERAVASTNASPSASYAVYQRDPGSALATLNGGLERDRLLFGLVARTSAAVHANADRLVSNATGDYREWLAGLVGLALITLLVALYLARFITLPIRRLAEMARAVSAGHLDVGHLPSAGPERRRSSPAPSMTSCPTCDCWNARATRWPRATSATPL